MGFISKYLMKVTFLCISSLNTSIILTVIYQNLLNPKVSSTMIHYHLKYNNDGGCSYTASWLAHINLYRRRTFFVDICRAEAASTEMYV